MRFYFEQLTTLDIHMVTTTYDRTNVCVCVNRAHIQVSVADFLFACMSSFVYFYFIFQSFCEYIGVYYARSRYRISWTHVNDVRIEFMRD